MNMSIVDIIVETCNSVEQLKVSNYAEIKYDYLADDTIDDIQWVEQYIEQYPEQRKVKKYEFHQDKASEMKEQLSRWIEQDKQNRIADQNARDYSYVLLKRTPYVYCMYVVPKDLLDGRPVHAPGPVPGS